MTESPLSGVRHWTWPHAALSVPRGELRSAQPIGEAIEILRARLLGAVCVHGRHRHRQRAAGEVDDSHLPNEMPALGIRPPAALQLGTLGEGSEPPALLRHDASHQLSYRLRVRQPAQGGHQPDLCRRRPLRLPERRESLAEDARLDPRRRVTGRSQDALHCGRCVGRRAQARPQLHGRLVVGHRERVRDQLPLAVGETAFGPSLDRQGDRDLDRRPRDSAAQRSELLDLGSGADRRESKPEHARDRRLERLEARSVSSCQERPNTASLSGAATGIVGCVTQYVHGYGTPEQERLVEQAEHWRHRLISDGTKLEPGTRLLEVGTGAGAVLAVLGQEFPGLVLTGVDIEPKQLEFARGHLERSGVEATLVQADALSLPFEDESFDHVWMMWFLEHLADPVAALREARRVLVPGGRITAIEVDYSTCHAEPSPPAMEELSRAMVAGMAAAGWSDAGTRLPGWLLEAGFRELTEGTRSYWWQDDDLERQANYAADVLESAVPALAELPGVTGDELRAGLADLRGLPSHPGAGLGWTLHKSTAVR